jgi:two-component sensor histidine kinase
MLTGMEAAEEKIKQLESLLSEKAALLKEVYHRVKNNFQVIISLTNLQIESINNPLAKKILIELTFRSKITNKIPSMNFQGS